MYSEQYDAICMRATDKQQRLQHNQRSPYGHKQPTDILSLFASLLLLLLLA